MATTAAKETAGSVSLDKSAIMETAAVATTPVRRLQTAPQVPNKQKPVVFAAHEVVFVLSYVRGVLGATAPDKVYALRGPVNSASVAARSVM